MFAGVCADYLRLTRYISGLEDNLIIPPINRTRAVGVGKIVVASEGEGERERDAYLRPYTYTLQLPSQGIITRLAELTQWFLSSSSFFVSSGFCGYGSWRSRFEKIELRVV